MASDVIRSYNRCSDVGWLQGVFSPTNMGSALCVSMCV